ncbi:neuronal acetylcholine receptor subunit alpha-10-like isoform X2 [Ptychodera flava]|uniref:neuronal acetylcholine receptor subunit alpha-10-like isoform X2 n=1 Tax=Ptychodera flava TaxID=63121 RepID=UPI00396A0E84
MYLAFVILTVFHIQFVLAGKDFGAILFEDLFRDYNRQLRPGLNDADVVNITLGMTLTQIVDLDELDEKITINVWLRQFWLDERLRWNSSEYGGIDEIRVSTSQVWMSDIVLYNDVGKENKRPLQKNVILKSDGSLKWPTPALLVSTCRIDATYFPHDKQCCALKFGSWTFAGSALDVRAEADHADLSNFQSHSGWWLLEAPVYRHEGNYKCCNTKKHYPDVTYMIVLQRRLTYHVLKIFVPTAIISLIAVFAFYLPPASGERVALSFTTLLTIFVFNEVTTQSLPSSSEDLPILTIYFSCMIVIVGMSCISTVFILNFYNVPPGYQEGPDMHGTWLKYLPKLSCRKLRSGGNSFKGRSYDCHSAPKVDSSRGLSSVAPGTHGSDSPTTVKTGQVLGCNEEATGNLNHRNTFGWTDGADRERHDGNNGPERYNAEIAEGIQTLVRKRDDEEESARMEGKWREIAYMLDRLLFWLFLLVTVAIAVGFAVAIMLHDHMELPEACGM